MRLMIKVYLVIYAFLLLLAFTADASVKTDDFATWAVASAILFPPVFLPFALWRLVFGRKGDPLDRNLFPWPGTKDSFRVRDLNQSVFVYGKTGSGKSSGSGLGLMRGILKVGSGVLFLCSKPEDRKWITDRAREAGRSRDLIIVAHDTDRKIDAVDFQMKAGADARQLTDFMVTMKEMQTRGKGKGGSNDQFWELSEADEFLFSIEPLRLALGRVTVHEIRLFIATSPKSAECFLAGKDDERGVGKAYRGSFHCRVMATASANARTEIEKHDFASAATYWNSHYANLDSKPRSSVEAGMMNTLNVFSMGMVRSKLSDGTNVTPADLERGRIIVVDYPVSTWGATGKAIMGCWKYITEKHVLRRKYRPGQPPIVIYSDEAQNLLTEFDSKYIDECRSHGGSLVFLSQSLSNYKMALGEDAAKALCGQAGHSIFHVVDSYTAAYASEMVGKAMQWKTGGSRGAPRDLLDSMLGVGEWNGNINEDMRALIEPREFQLGRTGGKLHGLVVDSWVIRNSCFANGSTAIRVPWSQR